MTVVILHPREQGERRRTSLARDRSTIARCAGFKSVNKFLASFQVSDQAPLRRKPVNWRLGNLCSQFSPSRVAQSHSRRVLMFG